MTSFNFSIPQTNGSVLAMGLQIGECLFVLGANGSGKSSLMHELYRAHPDKARRISAHRQTWFSSNIVMLTGQQKKKTEHMIKQQDANPAARWREDNSDSRPNIAIYDLLDAENVRARAIANAVDEDNLDLAKTLGAREAPIKVINRILRLSNIPIAISVEANEQVLASKAGCNTYSIAELSDGERNALLLAATVLTVQPDTLILIDEPERHLHRSIISPLLMLLFAERRDCAFIVSTHEVMLPIDHPTSRTLLIRGCTYKDASARTYDTDLIDSALDIELGLKKEILGARRKVIFIEGTEESLDKSLYSLLFPDVSVIPKASCRDVEHAVRSLREAGGFHWTHPFGIIDNDGRTSGECDGLKERGIYALSVFSVESIYYHPDMQRIIAERHAKVTGESAAIYLKEAKAALLAAVKPHMHRLSCRVAERTIRAEFMQHLPHKDHIAQAKALSVTVDIPKLVASETAHLQSLIEAENASGIIGRYPVRETKALDDIARSLGFQDRSQYESSVRALLISDEKTLAIVRCYFGSLSSDLQAP